MGGGFGIQPSMSSGTRKAFSLGITQKGLVLVLVPVVSLLAFVGILTLMLTNTLAWLEGMDHSKAALLEQHRVQIAAVRSFVMVFDTNGQVKFRELDKLNDMFKTQSWAKLNANLYPELKEVIEEGERSKVGLLTMVEQKRASMLRGGNDFHFDRQTIYMGFEDMYRLSRRTIDIENKVREALPSEVKHLRDQIMTFIIAGLFMSVVISLALAYYFSNSFVRRLHRIQENTFRLAAQVPLPEPEEGGDEIAELDRVIFDTSIELEELRERELAILDNAADVICSLDSKLKFKGNNAALNRLWLYEENELLGKSLVSILEDGTADETRTKFQLIAEGSGEGEIENVVRMKDGRLRNMLWTVKWLATDETFYCVAHDVTEIRAVQKLKQDFLSIAGHDLRSPLASVSILVARLLDSPTGTVPEPVQRELAKTQGTMARLMELVNELLELEKLESGKLDLSLDCISASDVCKMAADTLEGMASKNRITIEKPKGDFAVIADERRLVQIVTNLLSNAIKFSPVGGLIAIELRRVETKGKPFIEIRVSDRGPGIPAEDLALIFEKFRQSRTSTTATTVKGTGLGLAIVKALAEAHGGTVGVESEEGQGSTFWIRVPEFEGDEEVEDELP